MILKKNSIENILDFPLGRVRLKNAYIIKGERVEKNDSGEIIKIYCTYDPKSKSGSGTEESLRKVKGTIHWIDKNNYEKISVNNYDRLFKVEAPDGNKDDDFRMYLNENSLFRLKMLMQNQILGIQKRKLLSIPEKWIL